MKKKYSSPKCETYRTMAQSLLYTSTGDSGVIGGGSGSGNSGSVITESGARENSFDDEEFY